MEKMVDTLFSVFLAFLTVPILGIALALTIKNPVLFLTSYAGVLSFGLSCIGLDRL